MAGRRAYPTDLSDPEWVVLEPLVPPPTPGGHPPKHSRRELIDALAYWVRAGCAWRLLPHDFPPFLWNLSCQAAPTIPQVDMRWLAGPKTGRLRCCGHGDLWFQTVVRGGGRRDSPGA
ncbi:transposase [Streptomyces sp. NRRL B-1677]|uniref:transposase n=1 Tax=Streptomyces sp. NRRL B-1677 TaxID=2682966 RepID=UPI003A7F1FC1